MPQVGALFGWFARTQVGARAASRARLASATSPRTKMAGTCGIDRQALVSATRLRTVLERCCCVAHVSHRTRRRNGPGACKPDRMRFARRSDLIREDPHAYEWLRRCAAAERARMHSNPTDSDPCETRHMHDSPIVSRAMTLADRRHSAGTLRKCATTRRYLTCSCLVLWPSYLVGVQVLRNPSDPRLDHLSTEVH